MKTDHPAYAGAARFVDMGFLSRRYGVAHKSVQSWVTLYVEGKTCSVHLDRPHSKCAPCATVTMPPVPQATALRNGSAPLWHEDQVSDWDGWVKNRLANPDRRFLKRDSGLSLPAE